MSAHLLVHSVLSAVAQVGVAVAGLIAVVFFVQRFRRRLSDAIHSDGR